MVSDIEMARIGRHKKIKKYNITDYIAMAAKPPLLHDVTDNAFMQKQFLLHNISLPINYLIWMSNAIQKQLGQVALTHCSHFG